MNDLLDNFMEEYARLHPPPDANARDNRLLRFGLGLAVMCSFVVSAHRTVQAFGGDTWAVFAVGMVELALLALAYGLADMFHGERHNRLLIVGSIMVIGLTFAVTIGGNVYVSLKQAGTDNPQFRKVIAVLTGVIAPLMLFVGMELLASWKLTQERRVNHDSAKWEAERAKAWIKFRRQYGQSGASEGVRQVSERTPVKPSEKPFEKAISYLTDNPEASGLSVRQLAELLNIGRDTAHRARQQVSDSNGHLNGHGSDD